MASARGEKGVECMSEYIVEFGYEPPSGVKEKIVRCRDCKHATISTLGLCKYCEMWVLPDIDGYGCDSQVNLPLDFFCGFAERKEDGE